LPPHYSTCLVPTSLKLKPAKPPSKKPNYRTSNIPTPLRRIDLPSVSPPRGTNSSYIPSDLRLANFAASKCNSAWAIANLCTLTACCQRCSPRQLDRASSILAVPSAAGERHSDATATGHRPRTTPPPELCAKQPRHRDGFRTRH
jgi:hypothetical protein